MPNTKVETKECNEKITRIMDNVVSAECMILEYLRAGHILESEGKIVYFCDTHFLPNFFHF